MDPAKLFVITLAAIIITIIVVARRATLRKTSSHHLSVDSHTAGPESRLSPWPLSTTSASRRTAMTQATTVESLSPPDLVRNAKVGVTDPRLRTALIRECWDDIRVIYGFTGAQDSMSVEVEAVLSALLDQIDYYPHTVTIYTLDASLNPILEDRSPPFSSISELCYDLKKKAELVAFWTFQPAISIRYGMPRRFTPADPKCIALLSQLGDMVGGGSYAGRSLDTHMRPVDAQLPRYGVIGVFYNPKKDDIKALCELLSDPDAYSRFVATWALGQMRVTDDVVEGAGKALTATSQSDDDYEIRKLAAVALSRLYGRPLVMPERPPVRDTATNSAKMEPEPEDDHMAIDSDEPVYFVAEIGEERLTGYLNDYSYGGGKPCSPNNPISFRDENAVGRSILPHRIDSIEVHAWDGDSNNITINIGARKIKGQFSGGVHLVTEDEKVSISAHPSKGFMLKRI